MDFVLGGVSHVARAGDFIHVPRRGVHSFTVLSPTARVLATYAPAGEERRFFAPPED